MSKINATGVLIEVGSKWEMVRFSGSATAPFKVMGFVDSRAMIRRKNAAPICQHINTFGAEIVKA